MILTYKHTYIHTSLQACIHTHTGPLEPAELERSISDAGGWRCYDGAHEPGQGMLLAFLGFYE